MEDTLKGQLTRSAAEVYEESFVPTLFAQFAAPTADAAGLAAGQRVLDVACGTGVLAREAADRVAPGGGVTGLDCSEAMLEVARHKAPAIDWRAGRAESLPFPGQTFDAVVSQFGLMFFDEPVTALREMWRVLRPGGRLAVAVWDALERSPGYAAMAALLDRLFGSRVAAELQAPFRLGDPARLRALFTEAGISDLTIRPHEGIARYPSLDFWMDVDVKGWTLGNMLDDDQHRRLIAEGRRELGRFVQPGGGVAFAVPAHLVLARKDLRAL